MKDKARVIIDGKKLSIATLIYLIGKAPTPKKDDDKSIK